MRSDFDHDFSIFECRGLMLLLPPSPQHPHRPSHASAYTGLVRRARLSSTSAVVLLVATTVEGICGARLLKTLLDRDAILHTLLPVGGFADLAERAEELAQNTELDTIFLVGLGSILALSELLPLNPNVTIHVIDSHRPWNLDNAFGGRGGDSAAIYVWDDENDRKLPDVGKSWEAMEFVGSDSDSDDSVAEESEVDASESEEEPESPHASDDDDSETRSRRPKKRRKKKDENKLSREQKEVHDNRIMRYYSSGAWCSTPITISLYAVCIALDRSDNSLLWLAIMGLTVQYTSGLIHREEYDAAHVLLSDEVARLNPPSKDGVDDDTIRSVEDLSLPLLKHWSLYSALIHSNYVAGKLGVWKEGGKKQLAILLAEMGIPLDQSRQSYSHMDTDLKATLSQKFEDIGPRHGLSELIYPSFVHSYGYRTNALSSADAVESVDALLQAATGIRLDVELPGGQGGGEWFGGTRIWRVPIVTADGIIEGAGKDEAIELERQNHPGVNGVGEDGKQITNKEKNGNEDSVEPVDERQAVMDREKARDNINFWHAFDSVHPKTHKMLDLAIPLSKALHQRVLRQGALLIENKAFKTFSNFRMAVIREGPDVSLFTHSTCLVRLGRWLIDALRDVLSKSKVKKGQENFIRELPFVLACLDEAKGVYVVAGVTGSSEYGDVRKNKLGLAFAQASEATNARTRQDKFDAAIVEVLKEDFKYFIEGVQDVLRPD